MPSNVPSDISVHSLWSRSARLPHAVPLPAIPLPGRSVCDGWSGWLSPPLSPTAGGVGDFTDVILMTDGHLIIIIRKVMQRQRDILFLLGQIHLIDLLGHLISSSSYISFIQNICELKAIRSSSALSMMGIVLITLGFTFL